MFRITKCFVLDFPSGRWGYVGAVPVELCDRVPANRAAVLGGRAQRDESGELIELRPKTFDTREAAVEFAESHGVELGEVAKS